MKRLLYGLMAGLFLPVSIIAQCTDEWVQQISGLPTGNLANVSPSMVVDHLGNVIVCNVIVGADTIITDDQIFPETYSFTPNSDLFLAKYNSLGSLVWLKTIIGEQDCAPLDIAVDDDGNIYVGGLMSHSITIEGVVYERPGATQLGFFIMKLSASGDLQWLQKSDFNGSRCYSLYWTGEDLAFAIPFTGTVELDGQVYSADVPVNPSYQDILFGRLSPNGELLSAFQIGGMGNVDVRALICDESGYLLQGQFDLELTFDGATLTTPAQAHYSLYQLAVSNDGSLLWAHKSMNGPDLYVLPYGMGLTNGDKVIFSGVYDYSALTIDGMTIGNTAARDIFVGELNRSDGSVNWLKKASGSQTDYTETLVSKGANSWLGGYFWSSQFDYEGFQLDNTNDGEYDGFVVSIDNDGKPRCGIGFHGNGQEAIRSIQITEDLQLLALVSFNNTIEFNGQTYTAQGNYDLLVIKTCLPCDTLTSIAETTQTQPVSLNIYPNPFSTQCQLNYRTAQGTQPTLQLTDMLGRTVQTIQLSSHEGTYILDAATLGTGIYFCSLVSGAEVLATQKLVVINLE